MDLGVALESQPWSSSHCTRLHQISTDPLLCKGRTVWRSAASTRGDLHTQRQELVCPPWHTCPGESGVSLPPGAGCPWPFHTLPLPSCLALPEGPCFIIYLLFINKHLLTLSQTDHHSIKSRIPQSNSAEYVISPQSSWVK